MQQMENQQMRMWILTCVSTENADADLRTLPFSNLKRISGTESRNQNKGKIFMDVCYCLEFYVCNLYIVLLTNWLEFHIDF
jgi:hypothetical protein